LDTVTAAVLRWQQRKPVMVAVGDEAALLAAVKAQPS
jgi:hypothetical protein